MTLEQKLKNKERVEKWRKANKDRIKSKNKEYYENNPKAKQSKIDYRVKNYAKIRNKHLQRKYSISLEEYNRMLQEQDGVCKICKEPPDEDKVLYVDHCDKTGEIRGLLHNNCNLGIGHLKHNLIYLQNAIEYLTNVKKTSGAA